MNIIGKLACAVSLLALCASCKESIFDDTTYAYKNLDDNRIVIDPVLAKKFRVISIDCGMNESGFYAAKVTGECEKAPFVAWMTAGDNQIVLEYKFSWVDKNGASGQNVQYASTSLDSKLTSTKGLAYDGKWQSRTAMPGDIIGFSCVSPSYNYTDFKLEIREKSVISGDAAAKPAAEQPATPVKK